MSELLPCPFCGNAKITANDTGDHDEWEVACSSPRDVCPVKIVVVDCVSEAEAFAAWNRRLSGQTATPEPWVVWSNEHNAWWGADQCGYRTELLGAGIYTEQQAKYIEQHARSPQHQSHRPEIAMPLSDALARHGAGVGGDTVIARLLAGRLSRSSSDTGAEGTAEGEA